MPLGPASSLVLNASSRLLALPVAAYIHLHRARFGSTGYPLSAEQFAQMSTYFSAADLHRVRIIEARPLPVLGHRTWRVAHSCGLTLNPAHVEAITFGHVILAQGQLAPRTLFHEIVHVVQYRLLGVYQFAARYMHGYLRGGYDAIDLERCAYSLDARYDLGERFDAESAIRQWLD